MMESAKASPIHPEHRNWAARFLVNVAWGWLGVLASFFTGFILSPYIIRKLGDQRYGIWALAFAFIDYFTLFDFGFKSAIVTMISQCRARDDETTINQIINTAFFYFAGLALLLMGVTWLIAGDLYRFFQITPAYRSEFASLVRIVGVGWAFAVAFNVFVAGQEGFQQFKFLNQIQISSLIFRSGLCALVLYLGHGLTVMGLVVMASQFMTFTLAYFNVRHAFPALHLSPSLVRRRLWKQMAGYGVHAFVAQLSTMLINQGPPVLIGHFRPEACVGYYTLPARLLQYVVEFVAKIGSVTLPNAAELLAQGRRAHIARLSTYLNRYCFALFLPFSVFLFLYRWELIRMWVGASFALQSAPLVIPFVLSTSIAVAGQFNSVGILFGMAKHSAYAKALMVEGIIAVAGISAVLPRFGIVGAAWVAASAALLNRGLFTAYLLCRTLEMRWLGNLRAIYVRPLLLAAPTFVLGYVMKLYWLRGRNWLEILSALALLGLQYYLLYFFTGVEKEHRSMLYEWAGGRLGHWFDVPGSLAARSKQ